MHFVSVQQPAVSTGNRCRLISTGLLALLCLLRVERYLSVATHPVARQGTVTEQVERATPDYRIPAIAMRNGAPGRIVSPRVYVNDYCPAARLHRLADRTVFILTVPVSPGATPLPDPFGYLHRRRPAPAADDDTSVLC